MDLCSVCAVFICIVSLLISQGVDGGSFLEVEQSTESPRQKLRISVIPNYHLMPVVLVNPRYEARSSKTVSTLPSPSSAQSQIPNKNEKSRIWIHSFQIPSDWAKYLQNYRKEEQSLNTKRESRGNLTRPFEVSGNNSGTRTQSNINLPRIKSIPTLHLWSGDIRYNRSEVPKSEYEPHELSHNPSGIGGSRQGMVKLSGLEGDHTNNSSTWMNKENTQLNGEERQKPRIHYSPNYTGWSEDKPETSSGTPMELLSSVPRTERTKPELWFVRSSTLPAWSGNVQNSGYNEQLLNTSNGENQRSQQSRISREVSTRPIRTVTYDPSPRERPLELEIDLPKFESNPTHLMCPDGSDCSQYNGLFNYSKQYESSVPKNQKNTLGVRYIASTPAGIQGSRQGMPQLKGLEGSGDGINSSRIYNKWYLPIGSTQWSNEPEREKH